MAACEANPDLTSGHKVQIKQTFYPSQHVLISCGCVGVDPVARKIAILRDEAHGIVQLPKGRKNIGEDLLATALREMYEETGLRFSAMPLKVATRATLPLEQCGHLAPGENQSVTSHLLNCEPSSVCVHPCIYTGAFKIIFWFAAMGDSTQTPDSGTKEPWEEDDILEWVDAKDAAGLMSVAGDGDVIEKVLSDMRNTGYNI